VSTTQAYRLLAGTCPALRLAVGAPGPAEGPGWVNGAALAHDERALDGWLEAEAARIAGARGQPVRPDVAASRALHRYLWAACLLVSGPWYLERRVPRLRPEHVWLGPGAALRAAVPDAFACLPGDPEAAAAATVRDGEEALRADLRRTVAHHAAPLLAAMRSRTRRGPRALWGMVGDDLVSGLWHLGAALGDEEHGAAMAALVLPAALPPFPRRRGLPAGGRRARGRAVHQDPGRLLPLLRRRPAGRLPDLPPPRRSRGTRDRRRRSRTGRGRRGQALTASRTSARKSSVRGCVGCAGRAT
jgi:hypothetical protein